MLSKMTNHERSPLSDTCKMRMAVEGQRMATDCALNRLDELRPGRRGILLGNGVRVGWQTALRLGLLGRLLASISALRICSRNHLRTGFIDFKQDNSAQVAVLRF